MTDVESKVYSAIEVAKMFGVSPSLVNKIARRDGAFMGVRALRVGSRALFSKAAINAVLAKAEEPPDTQR